MKTKNIGLLLIVIGAIMMIYTGFSYVTTKKVVDIGPIEINKEQKHPVQWSPWVGGLLIAGGVVFLFVNKDKK